MSVDKDYMTLPLEQFTVRDMTDALGVLASANLLGTTRRAIYTTRNTNKIGTDRALQLINEIRKNEAECRTRLVVTRNMRAARAAAAAAATQ